MVVQLYLTQVYVVGLLRRMVGRATQNEVSARLALHKPSLIRCVNNKRAVPCVEQRYQAPGDRLGHVFYD